MKVATISSNDAQDFTEKVSAFCDGHKITEKHFYSSSVAGMAQQQALPGLQQIQSQAIIITIYSCTFFFKEVKQLAKPGENGET